MSIKSYLSLFILCTLVACKDSKHEQITEVVPEDSNKETLVDNDHISLAVIPSKTVIKWSCSKPGKTHSGRIRVKEGNVRVSTRKVIDADMVIDMSTIRVEDLEGDSKEKLERHLMGLDAVRADDFFNIRKYPFSEFSLNKVVSLLNDDNYKHLVYGDLRMRDVTKEIAFRANIEFTDGGLTVMSEEFSINRTDWGIKFMSKNFFDDLKDNFIQDEVKLRIELEAGSNF